VLVSLADGWLPDPGESPEVVWVSGCCRSVRLADDGWRLRCNRQHYRIQWLERPGPGAWAEACPGRNRTGMIYWRWGGAMVTQAMGTTLRVMLLTEGCGTDDHR
jgi:hypothetical protein